ncbi:hypothetical protein FRC10_007436 [Ceratobasidium sp. 414]|nr:hypothetical protein FRC10_007436 [Ceratobasidium sp. 414]
MNNLVFDTELDMHNFFPGTFECSVCLDSKDLNLATTIGKCGHVLCKPCLGRLNLAYTRPTTYADEEELVPPPCPNCKRRGSHERQLPVSVRPVHNDGREALGAQLAIVRQQNRDLQRQIDAINEQVQTYAPLSRRMQDRLDILRSPLAPTDVSPAGDVPSGASRGI